MDEDKDDEHVFTEEKAKHRTVKYHQHGILKETFYRLTNVQTDPGWVFDGPDGSHEFIGEEAELIGILDDLSKEGYEVVCNSDDGYILRTDRN